MTHTQHELPPMSDERNKSGNFGLIGREREYGKFGHSIFSKNHRVTNWDTVCEL